MTSAVSSTAIARPRLTFATMVAGVMLMLMIPAIINGGPFIFFDSDQYFTVGQRIFEIAFGGSGGGEAAAPAPAVAASPASDAADGELAAVAGGRLPIYSAGLYFIGTFLGLWTVALLQALVCALLIVRFCQLAWGRLDWKPVLAIAALLSLLNGLGFHAAFMMPDVFAGCLVLALAIFLYFRPAGRIENVLLVAGAFVMATLHTTNLLLVVSALIAALIVLAVERKPLKPTLPRLGVVAGIAAAALAFNIVYAAGVRAVAGEEVRSPPYLMARVLGDGTGEAYLAKHCTGPREPFAACAYKGKHFYSHDAFLWEPATGGFQKADQELRAQLSAEELRFVLAVGASDPMAQVGASMRNFVLQIGTAGIEEVKFGTAFLAAGPTWRQSGIVQIAPDAAACARPDGCAQTALGPAWSLIVGTTNLLLLPLFVAGLLLILTRRRSLLADLPDGTKSLMRVAGFLALLVLANAAICGILSGVNGRYQTRMIWTLALSMMTLAPLMLPAFRRLRLAAIPAAGRTD